MAAVVMRCTRAGQEFMQSIRPETTEPIPLRRTQSGVGTIMIRFVGLLLAATVVLVLIWSR